jgi:hypothetical protein
MTMVPQGSVIPATGPLTLLIATRKGTWFPEGDGGRWSWAIEGPVFLGQMMDHLVRDPSNQGTLLMATRTGHLCPNIYRSTDDGKSQQEVSQPPAFAKAPGGQKGRVVDHAFWLTPGHRSEPGVWYAGTSPKVRSGRKTRVRAGNRSPVSTSVPRGLSAPAAGRTAAQAGRSCIRS